MMPYAYLLDPCVRDDVFGRMEGSRTILIFDEAHNVVGGFRRLARGGQGLCGMMTGSLEGSWGLGSGRETGDRKTRAPLTFGKPYHRASVVTCEE